MGRVFKTWFHHMVILWYLDLRVLIIKVEKQYLLLRAAMKVTPSMKCKTLNIFYLYTNNFYNK